MSHLLKLVKFDKVKPSIQPLAFEFQANNEATPFLVSTSKSLLWITEAPKNVVRAAVRPKTKIQDFYVEVIQEVKEVGQECSWGNSHSFCKEGVLSAASYVNSYGVGEVVCLLSSSTKEKATFLQGTGLEFSICNWLSQDFIAVVPKDRSLLGFVGVMNSGFVSVIQNPSRCLAFAGEL